jgi:5-methylcytosine-specific restriction endonuclease McrA
MVRAVTAFGVTYGTITEAAKAHGVNVGVLGERLRRGVPAETALSSVKRLFRPGTSVEAFGVKYKSLAEAARAHGMEQSTVFHRVKRGVPIEEALSHEYTSVRVGNVVVVAGVEYPSVTAACKAIGVPWTTVKNRSKNTGLSHEDLLNVYAKDKNAFNHKISVTVRGVEYETICAFAASIGVHRDSSTPRKYRKKYPELTDDEICELWLSQKEATEKRVDENKAKAQAKRAAAQAEAAKRLVQGDYSALSFCRHCSKAVPRPDVWLAGWMNKKALSLHWCDDACKDAYLSEQKRESKRKARKEGKRANGRLTKRAKELGAKFDYGITAAKVAKRDGFKCQMCGEKVEKHLGKGWQPRGWSVGHIVPNSMGGHLTWDNVWCECSGCNSQKGDRVLPRWAFKQEAESPQLSFFEELDQSLTAWRSVTPTENRPSPSQ